MIRETIFVVTALFLVASCADRDNGAGSRRVAAIEGRVVEIGTGRPVGRAVIVAFREHPNGTAASSGQPAREAVSGEDGRFRIDGWAPGPASDGPAIRGDAPRLLLFKSGYAYRELAGGDVERQGPDRTPGSSAEGVVIELTRFVDAVENRLDDPTAWYATPYRWLWNARRWIGGMIPFFAPSRESVPFNMVAYSNHLRGVARAVQWIYEGGRCEWRTVPELITHLHRQAVTFELNGIRSELLKVDAVIPQAGSADPCGAREFYAAYLGHPNRAQGERSVPLVRVDRAHPGVSGIRSGPGRVQLRQE